MTDGLAPAAASGGRGVSTARPPLFSRLLARLVTWVASLLSRTFRMTLLGPSPPEEARPLVYAFLHGRQLGLLRYPEERRKVAVLASLSRDGALQAMVLGALGFSVLRGSSSRGGAAGLAALVRAVRGGAAAALAVDGPRGPLGEVKPGALFVARATGARVVPVTCAAAWALTVSKSWDRFMIPVPWSSVVLLRGEAFEVPAGAGSEVNLEAARLHLEKELARLSAEADLLVKSGGGQEKS